MSQEYEETQATQLNSQVVEGPLPTNDPDLWAVLIPCNSTQQRVNLHRNQKLCTFGRNAALNIVTFSSLRVSNRHCEIVWDGKCVKDSMVKLRDYSSNGTFINGQRADKNKFVMVREGMELAFGSNIPLLDKPKDDVRFIYRFLAAGTPTHGVYAHYEMSHELGKGSFATVMKAMSKDSGEVVAIKMINRQLGEKRKQLQTESEADAAAEKANPDPPTEEELKAEEKQMTAFRREIKVMEKLDHPNICGLREVFWEDSADVYSTYRCFLVLELVPGGDLLDYISRHEGLSEKETKEITWQICQALSYVHSKGVAHRDLKPENILLTEDKPPIVKVADFGLAKIVDSMTMLKTMCGTPSYLAPEVVNQVGQGGYDIKVDSWSVGVIVYSTYSNAAPFIENEDTKDVKERINNRVIDWDGLTNKASDAPSAICRKFIEKLLDVNPYKRMSLTEALTHKWLKDYEPPEHHRIPEDYWTDEGRARRAGHIIRDETGNVVTLNGVPEPSGLGTGLSRDTSMLSALTPAESSQPEETPDIDMAGQEANGIASTPPSPSKASLPKMPVSRTGSQTLQRRADVLRLAQDDPNVKLCQPSWEMLVNEGLEGGGMGNGQSNPLKRPLETVPEHGDAGDIEMTDATVVGSSKKSRATASVASSPLKSKGKSKAKSKASDDGHDDHQNVRRSGRAKATKRS